MSLENLFDEIRIWQRETFPNATAESSANHLLREAKELLVDPSELSELADVFILAVGVADQLGVGIEEIIKCKMEVNRSRVWGDADEYGVVEHVRDEHLWAISEEELEDNKKKYKVDILNYDSKKLSEYADSLLPQSQKSKEKQEELGFQSWEIRMNLDGELPG